MGRSIDIDVLFDYFGNDAIDETTRSNIEYFASEKGTVDAIPRAQIDEMIEEITKIGATGWLDISTEEMLDIIHNYADKEQT